MRADNHTNGFTLIELSIVLVIIGLVVGGVLVGRDLISSAAVRAQISQIEKYQTATNTFRGKYGFLPGDIKDPEAAKFGFTQRYPARGEGNGDFLIEGYADWDDDQGAHWGIYLACGETGLFWRDLSQDRLVDGSFNDAIRYLGGVGCQNSVPSKYYPRAKISNNTYVYVWSGGWSAGGYGGDGDSVNYFGLSVVKPDAYAGGALAPDVDTFLTVKEAHSIDTKIDDGRPQAGRVLAMYPNLYGQNANSTLSLWASNTRGAMHFAGMSDTATGGPISGGGITAPADDYSCYDNGNVGGATASYSIGWKAGVMPNCALSFKFQ